MGYYYELQAIFIFLFLLLGGLGVAMFVWLPAKA